MRSAWPKPTEVVLNECGSLQPDQMSGLLESPLAIVVILGCMGILAYIFWPAKAKVDPRLVQ